MVSLNDKTERPRPFEIEIELYRRSIVHGDVVCSEHRGDFFPKGAPLCQVHLVLEVLETHTERCVTLATDARALLATFPVYITGVEIVKFFKSQFEDSLGSSLSCRAGRDYVLKDKSREAKDCGMMPHDEEVGLALLANNCHSVRKIICI